MKKIILFCKRAGATLIMLSLMILAMNLSSAPAQAHAHLATKASVHLGSGTCQIVWQDSGLQNTDIGLAPVTDSSLVATLASAPPNVAMLDCNPVHSYCALTPGIGPNQDMYLDLSNIQYSSSWIYNKLVLGNYGLTCFGNP